jgi:peptidyl-dipeptidase Dcp
VSAEQTGTGSEEATTNPLLEAWTAPFGLPPFDRISPKHFQPAFDQALAEHRAEIAAIAGDPEAPTFANMIDAFQKAGRRLDRVSAVFFGLAGAHTSNAIQAVQREVAPMPARHRSAIFQDAALFRRVDELFARRDDLGLTPEQARVLERLRSTFVRAGARLNGSARERLAAIDEQLAALGTRFGQNVLADEREWVLVLETEEDLAGLPDFVRAAAARATADRGLGGRHAVTLARSSVVPFLQFSARRDLRERAFAAWTARGESGGDTDNRAIAAETLALRAERARLLGYPSFAHYRLDGTMAKTPDAVRDLLDRVWRPARSLALQERDELQAAIAEEGGNFALAPWDWRHYAEKVRRARHDLDEAEIKPYLQLDNMIAAAFDVAHRLFGLGLTELEGLPVYHPDVRVWEVRDAGGRHVGVFLGDYFARPTKRSGAWMGSYHTQERLSGDVRPIIANVANFAKGREGEPALLSLDEARTLFHEFGHALHGRPPAARAGRGRGRAGPGERGHAAGAGAGRPDGVGGGRRPVPPHPDRAQRQRPDRAHRRDGHGPVAPGADADAADARQAGAVRRAAPSDHRRHHRGGRRAGAAPRPRPPRPGPRRAAAPARRPQDTPPLTAAPSCRTRFLESTGRLATTEGASGDPSRLRPWSPGLASTALRPPSTDVAVEG